jgi:hypothetical protein
VAHSQLTRVSVFYAALLFVFKVIVVGRWIIKRGGSAICTPEGVSRLFDAMATNVFYSCGGVIGLYFSIKRCAIIYIFASNGAFHQAPYLDAHGEADLCMRWLQLVFVWLN